MTFHSYKNDYFHCIFTQEETSLPDTIIYCSGVNITRFLPITRGRHRLGQNPAEKGLQIVNLDVRSLALAAGATPKACRSTACRGHVTPHEIWYTEQFSIQKTTKSLPDQIISCVAVGLPMSILKACMLTDVISGTPLEPEKLQEFLDSLCLKYGRSD